MRDSLKAEQKRITYQPSEKVVYVRVSQVTMDLYCIVYAELNMLVRDGIKGKHVEESRMRTTMCHTILI